mmetsp:Transcript_9293/g.13672  ORF Transcript_9293/g.13672 Transcript_9293/m.13672 type:complete len:85 (-) Transcript_9293:97-351(-)
MKYISMKMDPKGRMPEKSTTAVGLVYHFPSGIGLLKLFTLQGKSPTTAIDLPSIVPPSTNGQDTNSHIAPTTTIVPKLVVAADW